MKNSLKQVAIALLDLPAVGKMACRLLAILGKKEIVNKYKRIKAEKKLLSQPGFQEVRSGIFQGMKYPVNDAAGSYLAPKIVGSYEKELHPIIQRLTQEKTYKLAMDVGCAEGYYAVGFTKMIPGLTMYAFDTDQRALQLCKKIADANQVTDRIRFDSFCSPAFLASFEFPQPSIIICDCEGYEGTLFSDEAVRNLSHVDVLIELHDHLVPGVKQQLMQRLGKSHQLTIVAEMSKNGADYPFLSFLTDEEKMLVVSEGRNGILGPPSMEWLLAESLSTMAH